ncbi:hypothetical protein [Commensalibacter communis]|nr:hypothetical protein [Commensalibacter communis]CAI3933653.1 unnamed protein product [Commensalibacter communis]CAI3944552.1 unnamed protein product [Commensalibacter communis]
MNEKLIEELEKFASKKSDDYIDATSSAYSVFYIKSKDTLSSSKK